ncbi:MAG: class I SAM-dependent RNA methyltransferase [Deltaproteobacteria bacterium]|nr:class I SAM-dependent RNA methyltransferase [Deltaproteobacteria bacterium]
MRVHSIEGVVERIAPGGRALLRTADGVVFARGGLPGERVRVAVERAARGVRHGVVTEVLERSAERVAPDCALHPRCGGCDLLDLAEHARARVKCEIVRDALARVARLEPPLIEQALRPLRAPGPHDDRARRRVSVVLHGGLPTLSAPESHQRVSVERCPALHATLERGLAQLAAARGPDGVRAQLACDERAGAVLALERDARLARAFVDAGGRGAVLTVDERSFGDPSLIGEVTSDAHPCRSDAGVFAQATRFGGAAIRDEVMRAVAPDSGTRVLELFCGSGHLTVPLLAAGAHVEACEGDARAVRFCRDNVALVDAGARALVRQLAIDEGLRTERAPDVVVIDPPRAGFPGLARLADQLRPRRFVLVSCDPATGARDLASLIARGRRLVALVPIDAFPRTSHVEWVATVE